FILLPHRPLSISFPYTTLFRSTLLGNQLKFKKPDPVFNQYAMHTWFDAYDRRLLTNNEKLDDYIFVHFLPIKNSWIWQIPISNRSEEHTSELQSRGHLVCRLLL